MLPNRAALILGSVAALLGGAAPLVADMDWESTAGVIAGVIALATYVNNFVTGWQKHEEREFFAENAQVADSGPHIAGQGPAA